MAIRDPFRWIHLGALALTGIGLAWGNALMSMGQLLLLGNSIAWGIAQGDLRTRYAHAFRQRPLLVFLGFFLLHAIGMLWTTDLRWGLDLCRILAPLVVLPVVLSAHDPMSERERNTLLLLTAWATVASTFACLVLRPADSGDDFRSLSVFISHIRLALLLCVAVAVFAFHRARWTWLSAAQPLAVIWCIYFLLRLESLQGLAILAVLALVFLWKRGSGWSALLRWSSRATAIGALLIGAWVITAWVEEHYTREPIDLQRLDVRSVGGEHYYHDRERPQWENGHAVWIHVADSELYRGWSRRSVLPYDSADRKGHPLRHTLVRYLASKGLRKDSLGLLALTDDDVRRIEHGTPNVQEGRRSAVRERVEEVLFELDQYAATGDASGYSIAMRLEFWSTGLAIAQREWLCGVGTGDTQMAFDAEYERRGSLLDPKWRLRAHNQYLTWWISFGALGFTLALFCWWWPAFHARAFAHPVFLAWCIAFAIGCLTDDTVETQAGATFAAFFHALFVFGGPMPEKRK